MHESDTMNRIDVRLREGPVLLLDGATGTEIEHRGTRCDLPLWSARALLDCPEQIEKIHREYAKAGAEIITANTFRTQKRTLKRGENEYPRLGERDRELTSLAVQLARAGARGHAGKDSKDTWVAGSVAPLEDCYQPDRVPENEALEREHRRHAENLAYAGVDLLLIETMNCIREASAAARAAQATGLPFCVSFVVSSSGRLLSEESLSQAIDAVAPYLPLGVGMNCLPASCVDPGLAILKQSGLDFGLHTNLGVPGSDSEPKYEAETTPDQFARYARDWAGTGASWVGGCCGTTPAHTAAAYSALGKE